MLVAVIISHRLSPRATAQFGAEGKCSENILATMRSEAIRNKPATRNRIVRMRPILHTEVDGTGGAPNAIAGAVKRPVQRIVGHGRHQTRTQEVASYPPNLPARFGVHYVWPHPSFAGIDPSGGLSSVSHLGIASPFRCRLSTAQGPAGRRQ